LDVAIAVAHRDEVCLRERGRHEIEGHKAQGGGEDQFRDAVIFAEHRFLVFRVLFRGLTWKKLVKNFARHIHEAPASGFHGWFFGQSC